MMPTESIPPIFNFFDFQGSGALSLVMNLSFFAVLFFVSLSLLISFLHLMWYGTSMTKSYLVLVIFVAVSATILIFAYSLVPDLVLKINL